MAASREGGSQDQHLLRKWERQQIELKQQMIDHNTEDWQSNEGFEGLERVGGVDLSYIKGDEVNACASLVVLSYPDLKVVYEECQMVCLNAPYIPGFLAFRETPFLEEAVKRLHHKDPSLFPQIIFADGNGILHHRGVIFSHSRPCAGRWGGKMAVEHVWMEAVEVSQRDLGCWMETMLISPEIRCGLPLRCPHGLALCWGCQEPLACGWSGRKESAEGKASSPYWCNLLTALQAQE
ncbi:endonuclease V-like isoform X11 [Heterodontus francisci]|uniref:endonuclease V-like isoform X11 n=1 Tax=Heterodontus francisci TaxID=7792 RepID=UPI00355B60CB